MGWSDRDRETEKKTKNNNSIGLNSKSPFIIILNQTTFIGFIISISIPGV